MWWAVGSILELTDQGKVKFDIKCSRPFSLINLIQLLNIGLNGIKALRKPSNSEKQLPFQTHMHAIISFVYHFYLSKKKQSLATQRSGFQTHFYHQPTVTLNGSQTPQTSVCSSGMRANGWMTSQTNNKKTRVF